VFRSIALFVILWQFRLLAGDLADTGIFAATLAGAFTAALALARFKVKPAPALASLALIPWAARFFIALPRLFIAPDGGSAAGLAVTLDALLLGFDRNNFVSLLPYYYAALTTFFSARSRRFLRFDVIAGLVILALFFYFIRTADLEAYRWPVLLIGLLAAVVFLQFLALMFSLPAEYALRRGEKLRAVAALLVLVLAGGVLLIRPSQERAVGREGGLLQPNLFRFDFSQILRLESEITMNDDLVLIVRKSRDDNHIYLRRFVLSGYGQKQGFYRHEEYDEPIHPQRLPERRTTLPAGEILDRSLMEQEYFLVNFDPQAFIALNQPVEIIPYESWDASSFSSAYGVQSYVSDLPFFNLIDGSPEMSLSAGGVVSAGDTKFTAADLEMEEDAFAFYTGYGENERLAAFAREIVRGRSSYLDIVQGILERFRYGEYRYSFKPGIAPDGDQLSWFLYETKRGYCSYFAFAMTLMLRSLGIPSRVAVGFFLDAQDNTFNYYPVRSDMAHAWVEVYCPGYGWIDYDPTTTELAEGEEFNFSMGVPPELFERLMKEILDNRSRIKEKEGEEGENAAAAAASLVRGAGKFLKQKGWRLALMVIVILFLFMRCGSYWAYLFSGNPRKRTVLLYAHALHRLRLAGFRRPRLLGKAEWARELDETCGFGLYPLYQDYAKARYGRDFAPEEAASARSHYFSFSKRYAKTVSPARRILAWVLPPLALSWRQGKKKSPMIKPLVLFLLAALSVFNPGIAGTQESPGELTEDSSADKLYNNALDAQLKENWERAISLYKEGQERYPNDSRFSWTLGSLYYSRGLYLLAWEEYRKTEVLLPYDPDVLYHLSRAAGHLNMDALSAEYLERVLEIVPNDRDAIGSLAWMYYKLHRLRNGEMLLLSAMDKMGEEPDFAMTLGTIYSDMFRYEEAKYWYLRAIEGGEELGDREFTAVAHYNLSILESRYYNYAEAFDRTNASLSSLNRASGRLARGEIYMRRLELPRAFSDYQSAYEVDTSPLSKVNLAQAYQIAGRLEEARLYAENCLDSQDLSWMLNYGIDTDRYRRDLHEILYKTYSGLTKTENRKIYAGVRESIRGFFLSRYYAVKSASHRYLYQKYSLKAARSYDAQSKGSAEGGTALDAQTQYYNAFEAYPGRAGFYLRNARNFEVPLIPGAEPSYDAEEGTLLKDRALLYRSIPAFDPLWERDMIADTYTELCLQLRGRRNRLERWDAAERLYALNKAGLRQNGIRLPVELVLNLDHAVNPRRTEKVLRRILDKIGVETPAGEFRAGDNNFGNRYRLSITLRGEEALCELYDGGRGTNLFRQIIALPSLSRKDLALFAETFGDAVFIGY
jgi:lipopolysaccharide biosynthesis regulator YciM